MGALLGLLRRPITIRLCQIAIGLIFIVAGLAKIGDAAAFAKQVHNFRIAPVVLENLVAATLPWVELVAGVSLVIGLRARAGAVITTSLMAVFTLAVIAAVAKGLDIDCGCFGTSDGQAVGLTKIAQNFGMLAISVVATLRRE